jgi:hypothetical protein
MLAGDVSRGRVTVDVLRDLSIYVHVHGLHGVLSSGDRRELSSAAGLGTGERAMGKRHRIGARVRCHFLVCGTAFVNPDDDSIEDNSLR